MLPRVTSVRHLADYRLELHFSDGACGEIDFRERVVGRGGVFAPLADLAFFRQVAVDPEAGTLVWPNGVDLCPDVLYSEITGAPLPGQDLAAASAERGRESPVEALHPRHAPARAAGQVEEVAGAETGVPVDEKSGELDVLDLDRPHDGDAGPRQGERGVEGLDPSGPQVGVQELLQDLGGGDEHLARRQAPGEELPRLRAQRVLAADGIHEDVRVDEDHASGSPSRVKVSGSSSATRL